MRPMKWCVLFLGAAKSAWGAEFEVGADGSQKPPNPNLSVELENNCGADGVLMWVHPESGQESKMFDIGVGATMTLNTYASHRFALYDTTKEGASPLGAGVVVNGNDVYYHLCPEDTTARSKPAKRDTAPLKPRRAVVPDVDRSEFDRFKTQRPVAAKFKNVSGKDVNIYYMDGGTLVYNGLIKKDGTSTINSYDGHRFRFTSTKDETDVIVDFAVSPDQKMYLVVKPGADLSLLPPLVKEEIEFSRKYKEEHGIFWNSFYPRGPPEHHMWEANELGQTHAVTTSNAQYLCDPRGDDDCFTENPTTFNLTVISTHPKVFQIDNFLSDVEVDHIIGLASPKIARSTTGNGLSSFESSTRTSSNTWIQRKTDSITDNLYRRVADVVKMPEEIITDYSAAESIQVVHYNIGQKYDAHHDWGVTSFPNSRFITLLMYLSDMDSPAAGGETAFPLAQFEGYEGTKVHPGKGSAIMFYNLLEDGNADDLTLHAALPVKAGDKWLANFWIWDPIMKTD